MGDETLSFDEHRRRRADDDETRCPECGVHFQGRAEDFWHPSEQITGGRPLWVVVVAIALLAMMIAGGLFWR